VLDERRAEIERRELRLHAVLNAASVQGDPQLLERLTANLIDNGIRHNERHGFLSVTTGVEGQSVVLSVRNGGPVIPVDDAKTLTEPFRRLDRTYGGFGLGLSVVRSVVEAHGGTLEVRAPQSGGLDVRVALDARRTTPGDPAEQASVGGLLPVRTLTQS